MKSETNEKKYHSDNDTERRRNLSQHNRQILLNSTKKKSSQEQGDISIEYNNDISNTKKKISTPKKLSQTSLLDSEIFLKSIEHRKKTENYKISIPDIKSLKCNLGNRIDNTTNENNCFNTNYNTKIDIISSNSSQDSIDNENNPQSNKFINNFGSKTKIDNNSLFTYQKKRYKNEEDYEYREYSQTDKIRKYNKKRQIFSQEINMESENGIVNFRLFRDKDIGFDGYQGFEDEIFSDEYEYNDIDWNEIFDNDFFEAVKNRIL